jgi:hypothetical protein
MRSGRGVASVEAAIVLPFFVIVFVSLYYVKDRVLARQAANIHARQCAWAYAMKNCQEIPAGCEHVVGVSSEGDAIDEKIVDKLGDVPPLLKSALKAILQPALEAAFGRALDARTEKAVNRPALYGGGTATTQGQYHLACNLAPQAPADVAYGIWHETVKHLY